ncbi:protein naked cuticle homolog 1 isoform X2 [Pteropus medius]|uniref:protein naked cuticle homolog 1 isoform X2 n=1 Tax=Pteropus vampyrus TaxID=132908 RepID=UPI00196A417B|nr:protein naked cuticle homolog 1 isoform X2 [Pteropus giganteus]
MGKLHSKPGDSFAVSAAWARKGIDEWMGRQRCPGGGSGPRQLRAAGNVGRGTRELVGEVFRETLSEEEQEDFQLEVALPPEKTDGLASGDEKRTEKPSESCPGSRKPLKFEELQCDVSVEEDSRQEWTFTLYDFDNGKVTREVSTCLASCHWPRPRAQEQSSCAWPRLLLPSPGAGSAPREGVGGNKAFWCFIENWRGVPELPSEWGEVTEQGQWGFPALSLGTAPPGRAAGRQTLGPSRALSCFLPCVVRALGWAWGYPGHFPPQPVRPGAGQVGTQKPPPTATGMSSPPPEGPAGALPTALSPPVRHPCPPYACVSPQPSSHIPLLPFSVPVSAH